MGQEERERVMIEDFRYVEHSAADINRTIPKRYRLQAYRSTNCGQLYVTERLICPDCKKRRCFEPVPVSGRGKVYTFTSFKVPLMPLLKRGAYALVIAELEEGVKAEAQMVDMHPDDVKIGMPVETTIRRARVEYPGKVVYMYRFRPAKKS